MNGLRGGTAGVELRCPVRTATAERLDPLE
jgi:hypothetical protein